MRVAGDTFRDVTRRTGSIGRPCLHCPRSATVTARRVSPAGQARDVEYCDRHFAEIASLYGLERL